MDNSFVSLLSRNPRVFGAAVIGPLHVQMNLPCQDACCYQVLSSNAIVIAVADGLGSASASDAGAKLAVESAVKAMVEASVEGIGSHEDIVRYAVSAARSALQDRAAVTPCELRDLACTLILAFLAESHLAVAHIGDGAVVAQAEGQLHLVSAPGDSEFTNEVVPLTSTDWEKEVRITSLTSHIDSIAVFTDGCQRAAFRKSENGLEAFDRFFNPIFAYARDLLDIEEGAKDIEALLASKKICENSDDDKTLVVGSI